MNKYREELRKEYEGETGMYWAHESTLWANWLESKLEQAEKEKKELVEFVKNKINGCDELTGMEREKWAFQQVLNQIEL